MSYEEAKRAHDEQMTRVRAALAGDDPREAAITLMIVGTVLSRR